MFPKQPARYQHSAVRCIRFSHFLTLLNIKRGTTTTTLSARWSPQIRSPGSPTETHTNIDRVACDVPQVFKWPIRRHSRAITAATGDTLSPTTVNGAGRSPGALASIKRARPAKTKRKTHRSRTRQAPGSVAQVGAFERATSRSGKAHEQCPRRYRATPRASNACFPRAPVKAAAGN